MTGTVTDTVTVVQMRNRCGVRGGCRDWQPIPQYQSLILNQYWVSQPGRVPGVGTGTDLKATKGGARDTHPWRARGTEGRREAMAKGATVRLLDDFELRCNDSMNWQLWQRRESFDRETGERREAWAFTGSHHRTVGGAIMWLLEKLPKTRLQGREGMELAEYASWFEGLERQLLAAARKASKAVPPDGAGGAR